MMSTAIFLGAGAAKVEGAPLQNELVKMCARSFQQLGRCPNVAGYLKDFFGIHCLQDDLEKTTFPTFEEVIGLIDLAELRGETLRWPLVEGFNADNSIHTLRLVRDELIFMMSWFIDYYSQEEASGSYECLLSTLNSRTLLDRNRVIFLTSNYDLLLEKALSKVYASKKINYGVDFARVEGEKLWRPTLNAGLKFYKIHGSLDWLYCTTCNNILLKYVPISSSLDYTNSLICTDCLSIREPVIVPPTYYKSMSNVFLGSVWNNAENALRRVTRVVFCGYSLPDADMHIKYLMKRAQTNRASPVFSVVVFNHYSGKDERVAEEEEVRYKRFFGDKVVDYTRKSFEEFVADPLPYLT
ncbi:hypothetical protein GF359_00890 [candidate division WOR-3 bacterium]|uniref:SIR2-like domain-containing protein n=1 Tax=candidate division WOR-3 bacterium TaxID=2052148 RepID=A0A9D5QBR3_UNCW3|nr:hypothetical protein [candidate division WOR-3 bacterium]MBD3363749.1 hypothetical protein [candidate division WOR-3 bacterium]